MDYCLTLGQQGKLVSLPLSFQSPLGLQTSHPPRELISQYHPRAEGEKLDDGSFSMGGCLNVKGNI